MEERKTSETVRFLYLVGSLSADNRLELVGSHLTDDPWGAEEASGSPLRVELYDGESRCLVRWRISVGSYCTFRTVEHTLAVRGKVLFHPATRWIRFYRDDLLVHEIEVSVKEPKVVLTWTPRDQIAEREKITWKGDHPQGKPVQFFLRYSYDDGANWQPICFPTTGSGKEIDFGQLPGGERCRIMVVATDGVKTSTAESKAFSVPVKPCRAMILQPVGEHVVRSGDRLTLIGQGYYLEENRIETQELAWSSSEAGHLGNGELLDVAELAVGRHCITLKAGTGRRVGQDEVVVEVVERQKEGEGAGGRLMIG